MARCCLVWTGEHRYGEAYLKSFRWRSTGFIIFVTQKDRRKMIQPQELRIGNYVWCLASVRGLWMPFAEVKVLTLGFDSVETCLIDKIPTQVEEWPKYEYRNIDPISLTEEWLLK